MSRAEDVIGGVTRAFIVGEVGFDAGPLMTDQAMRLTEAVIEAIRNLSPDDLAEVIGGEVETRVGTERLFPDVAGITHRVRRQRVVGPWQETP